ncbi:MAG: hypothetical protein OXD45_10680 [Rhodobacteraceae bacterium]|nr:hypothetical protein [Paracoccaceae bacterium]
MTVTIYDRHRFGKWYLQDCFCITELGVEFLHHSANQKKDMLFLGVLFFRQKEAIPRLDFLVLLHFVELEYLPQTFLVAMDLFGHNAGRSASSRK